MTADRADAAPSPNPIPTPGHRLRFALALGAFGAWVVALALLAARAEPPDPRAVAEPAPSARGAADRGDAAP